MTNEERIKNLYDHLDRRDFLAAPHPYSDEDIPLPIGHEQTISQPSLVLKMTQLLDVRPTDKVLEIGTGSGYQAALLAEAGRVVYTIERIEALYEQVKPRLKRLGYDQVHVKLGDGSLGWPEQAPFDRIMVTAAAKRIPDALIEQLAPGGRMVIPVGDTLTQKLLLITKDKHGHITKDVKMYVRFVELVEDDT